MEFIKSALMQADPKTVAEFEKSLIERGLVGKRSDAHAITLAVKSCLHLFTKAPPSAPAVEEGPNPEPPVLEESQYQKLREQIRNMAKALDS